MEGGLLLEGGPLSTDHWFCIYFLIARLHSLSILECFCPRSWMVSSRLEWKVGVCCVCVCMHVCVCVCVCVCVGIWLFLVVLLGEDMSVVLSLCSSTCEASFRCAGTGCSNWSLPIYGTRLATRCDSRNGLASA